MKDGIDAFNYTKDEKLQITDAMAEPHPWDSKLVTGIKVRIKGFHLQFGENMCCYCYRDLTGEFSLVIDIEHILPKRHYRPLTFDIRNLSVACKRCNMKMKRDKLDFLNLPMEASELELSEKYKIVHPNIDNRDEHLLRMALQINTKRIIKYITVDNSEKGNFSYAYFRLSELEVDSYDSTQGANQPDLEAIAEIRTLVSSIE